MKLMDGLLDEGRRLYTYNWNTSLPLAERLVQSRTRLMGINKSGITVLKCRDKRDILTLSTTHDAAMGENRKPQVVEDYNQAELHVDTSDQMASYSPFFRRTKNWYIRLFHHLLTQTALVNAWRLYNDNIQRFTFSDLKIDVIECLLDNERLNAITTRHSLEELTGPRLSLGRDVALAIETGRRKKDLALQM
ncbi:hypothetical protein ANCCAN_09137 [Ancylostoma caninum]|uniref:PiggyBac transposable element-derived protein domain-containing protein n=1 Tax=Ancylostoma caninum TaxID=29170 RepID=A0A368GPA9_ANCCA|nr:hypothetical protein ANCCAN_09137 [Ancylostoma caninum]